MTTYMKIAGLVIFLVALFGVALPYLMSLAVDFAVLLAIGIIVISIPITWIWIKSIIRSAIVGAVPSLFKWGNQLVNDAGKALNKEISKEEKR